MGLRYRKSIPLGKGIRLNTGKKGPSLSFSLGKGLSYNQKLYSSSSNRKTIEIPNYYISIQSTGEALFLSKNDEPLEANVINKIKKRDEAEIKNHLNDTAEKINKEFLAFYNLHTLMKSYRDKIIYEKQDFETPELAKPIEKKPFFLGKPFKFYTEKVKQENEKKLKEYEENYQEWTRLKKDHEEREERLKYEWEEGLFEEIEIIENALEQIIEGSSNLSTSVEKEVLEEGNTIKLKLVYPSKEMIPKNEATYSGRGYKINIKEIKSSQIQETYTRFIHAITCLYLGNIFYFLPKTKNIFIQGFITEIDSSTGHEKETPIIYTHVEKDQWKKINFDLLKEINPILLFDNFTTKRNISKNFLLKEIVIEERIETK